MDIRGPRLRKPSDEALAFTSSMASDGRIARHVIGVNMAHMAALVRAGKVDRTTAAKCMGFLLSASSEIAPDAKAEDFHQQLEQDAVDALGVNTAGSLNYGKSRNDQVATAIRMELRLQVVDLLAAIATLQQAILNQVEENGTTLIPGYTHLQRAQPVTLAHHLFAYFDAFQRDSERLVQLYPRVNLSPMGSAAMAGTNVKIDRGFVAKVLGFPGVIRNAMDAVSSRDIGVEALSCATMTMLDASRMAEELILWSTSEFSFIELDDAYAASSSIMPQKKNAVVAETVRAKTGSVIGDLVAACAILKALPYSYNLDLQEATPHLWRALDDAVNSVHVLGGVLASVTVKPKRLHESIADDKSTAVALANYLVEKRGVSFREAHSIVGQLVRTSLETGEPLDEVAAAKMRAASSKPGKRPTIDRRTAKAQLDPAHFLSGIATEGGSNPKFIAADLRTRKVDLTLNKAKFTELGSSLAKSEKKLQGIASGIAREVKPRD
ncbi:MAG TPA: argininosuccinate lyase [Nitrososphaerales archaeon]|nr:argininosuccinate lyase [Nitrososphaerales archaeon]